MIENFETKISSSVIPTKDVSKCFILEHEEWSLFRCNVRSFFDSFFKKSKLGLSGRDFMEILLSFIPDVRVNRLKEGQKIVIKKTKQIPACVNLDNVKKFREK